MISICIIVYFFIMTSPLRCSHEEHQVSTNDGSQALVTLILSRITAGNRNPNSAQYINFPLVAQHYLKKTSDPQFDFPRGTQQFRILGAFSHIKVDIKIFAKLFCFRYLCCGRKLPLVFLLIQKSPDFRIAHEQIFCSGS